MKTYYDIETELYMQRHYGRLPEKERRLYAAVECKKLGYGGQKYIRILFKIGQKTLERGLRELADPDLLSLVGSTRQRLVGGGRKKKFSSCC
jgi:hypothetical protein